MLAARLGEFASGVTTDSLPGPAARHVGLLIMDALGCALDGWAAAEIPGVVDAALVLAGQGSGLEDWAGQTTIIGSGTAPPLAAVLANAYLVTAVTECDVYVPAHCHLTPEVVPAALAAAEARRSTGAEFVAAVAAGLEVASRLLRALDYPEFRRRGWHSPGVIGPIGAAIAAGRLLGLGTDGLVQAMSLATSQAAGTFAAWPTTAVKFHQARGAMSGYLAAQLAADGFSACDEPFVTPDGGLFASYAPADPQVALAELGDQWELEQISLRLWPGATPVQPLLTALLAGGLDLPAAEQVGNIRIRVCPATYAAHCAAAHPASIFEALLSFHYIAAATVLNGRFGVDLADPAAAGRAEIGAFIDQKVTLAPDESLPRGPVVVEVIRSDGTTTITRQDHALGSPGMPASTRQVEAKFAAAARSRLPDDGVVDRLLQSLRAPGAISDCADLAGLTRCPSGGRSGDRRSSPGGAARR